MEGNVEMEFWAKTKIIEQVFLENPYHAQVVANDFWPILGQSSRVVFSVSDTLVLKLDSRGQNRNEAIVGLYKTAWPAIARVYDVGHGAIWLTQERVQYNREWYWERDVEGSVQKALLNQSTPYGKAWEKAIRFILEPGKKSYKRKIAYGEALFPTQWGFRGDVPVLFDLGVN